MRQRPKLKRHEAEEECEMVRVQCRTCTGVIASDEDIYCMSCKVHWSNYDNSEDY
jgi:hypothetical protein